MSENNTVEKPKTLYQKIAAVMKKVDYLQKDGKVEFKTTKYKAISEEKVTMAVRKALVEEGLVILPIEQEHSREGTLSIVNTKYKIVDIDTGEHEIIVSSGTGADTQDKGVGKAMTYSYKYLLLRTFAIPTGEDPDKVSSAQLDEEAKEMVSKKIGILKTKALEFAKARDRTDKDVYDALEIENVESLNDEQLNTAIHKLNGWLANVKKGA